MASSGSPSICVCAKGVGVGVPVNQEGPPSCKALLWGPSEGGTGSASDKTENASPGKVVLSLVSLELSRERPGYKHWVCAEHCVNGPNVGCGHWGASGDRQVAEVCLTRVPSGQGA